VIADAIIAKGCTKGFWGDASARHTKLCRDGELPNRPLSLSAVSIENKQKNREWTHPGTYEYFLTKRSDDEHKQMEANGILFDMSITIWPGVLCRWLYCALRKACILPDGAIIKRDFSQPTKIDGITHWAHRDDQSVLNLAIIDSVKVSGSDYSVGSLDDLIRIERESHITPEQKAQFIKYLKERGRTIVFALKQTSPGKFQRTSTDNFWGLGDMVKGMLTSCWLAKKFKYNFVIDVRYHPVSKILQVEPHGFENFVDSCIGSLEFTPGDSIEQIVRQNEEQVVCLFTNGNFEAPLEQDCLNKIKHALSFPLMTNEKYDDVVHVRMGDSEMLGTGYDESKIQKIVEQLKKIRALSAWDRLWGAPLNSTTVLMISDSEQLKKYAASMGFKVRNHTSSHFGLTENVESLTGILLDFMSLAAAKRIHYHSEYDWRSGFLERGSALGHAKLVPLMSL
jgi:hypothetical protein